MERDLKNPDKEFKIKDLRDLKVGVLLYVIGIIVILIGLVLYIFLLSKLLWYETFIFSITVFNGLLFVIVGMLFPYRKRIRKRKVGCLFVILPFPIYYLGFHLMIFIISPIGLMLFVGIATLILIIFITANL